MYTTVVYLDKVFLGNLLVNGVILWAAGRLSQVRVKHYRVLIGAGLGSLYSLVFFLPGAEQFFSFLAKVMVSLAMVAAAFAPLPPRKFALCLSFFYLVSFAAGGMVIGLSYLAGHAGGFGQSGSIAAVAHRHLWPGLLLALVVLWAGSAVLPRYFRGRNRKEAVKLPITIYLEGKRVTVRGLVDTGNSLCDPVSGDPVVVVEHGAVRDVLPGPMKDPAVCAGDAVGVIERMMDTPWSVRLRLIPFRSLGSHRGIMLGIKPDRIEFSSDGRARKVDKVVIGIHGRRLDPGRDYNAIINPSLLDRAIPA
ncbi:MAG: sigma-E processing peptidase SpoIIGA [Peptococcaceae bacterium]|nr:sigma-E processing peptidase SpoIIGA [Peptococcaceae bacterium]